jgi:dolichol kinase
MFSHLSKFGKRISSAPRLNLTRNFGSHGGQGPHFSVFHDRLGKVFLVATFLWIFYRAKENKGQLFVSIYFTFCFDILLKLFPKPMQSLGSLCTMA